MSIHKKIIKVLGKNVTSDCFPLDWGKNAHVPVKQKRQTPFGWEDRPQIMSEDVYNAIYCERIGRVLYAIEDVYAQNTVPLPTNTLLLFLECYVESNSYLRNKIKEKKIVKYKSSVVSKDGFSILVCT